jgi:broad specificity phosphatase PhoE
MRENSKDRTGASRTVWICRHGNRIDFVDPSWRQRNGHDPHLSEDGVRQALETGERLRNEGIRSVFASPFLRTVETAHYIADALGVPTFIEHGASEWLNPEWFAQAPRIASPEEMTRRFRRVDPNYVSVVNPSYPETAEQAFARAGRTARCLVEKHHGNLLIVGHGHSVTGMSWGLLGARPVIHTGLCALVQIGLYNGVWTLELNGDTSHLSDGEQERRRLH